MSAHGSVQGERGDNMIFDMPSCGGCRTCEIACSFHHTGEFQPSASSLKILNKQDRKGYKISLIEESDGKAIACDGCTDLEGPLCVQYCRDSEELSRMIKEFAEKMEGVPKKESA